MTITQIINLFLGKKEKQILIYLRIKDNNDYFRYVSLTYYAMPIMKIANLSSKHGNKVSFKSQFKFANHIFKAKIKITDTFSKPGVNNVKRSEFLSKYDLWKSPVSNTSGFPRYTIYFCLYLHSLICLCLKIMSIVETSQDCSYIYLFSIKSNSSAANYNNNISQSRDVRYQLNCQEFQYDQLIIFIDHRCVRNKFITKQTTKIEKNNELYLGFDLFSHSIPLIVDSTLLPLKQFSISGFSWVFPILERGKLAGGQVR